MKTTIATLFATSLAASAAVTMNLNFSGAVIGTPVDGYDGWTQSEPNTAPSAPLSWVGLHAGGKAAAVGGWFATPTGPVLSIEHGIGAAMDGAQVTLDFGIVPSSPAYPGQNDFSVVFSDSPLGDVFSMDFSGVGPQWNVGWSSSLAAPQPPFAGVLPMGSYTYVFSETGDDVHYSIYSATNALGGSATIPGLGGAGFDSIRIDWKMGSANAWGDNFFSLSHASICADSIPETSGVLALGLLVCAGLTTRKRK